MVGVALVSCGLGGRAADAPQPNLPSGVARPATATATTVSLGADAMSVPAQVQVTRIASEPTSIVSTAAQSVISTATAGGVTVLVLHTNDVRGYSLPCG